MRKTLIALILGVGFVGAVNAAPPQRFHAHLTGGDLAGRTVATTATGEAQFEVVEGTKLVNGERVATHALKYRINVAGINNLFQAHIHVSSNPGPIANDQPVGPVVFWFVPTVPPAQTSPAQALNSNVAERVNGRLADGFVMTDGQLVGPLACDDAVAGCSPDTGVAGLIKAIKDGRATVVVHTSDLDNTNNQIPCVAGDSPPGELRGLIR